MDLARAQIDNEIQRIEATLRNLKSLRNTFSPIARLPQEVLQEILISYCFSVGHTEWSSGQNLSWIKVTHISRSFRSAALDCPRIWSSPVFTGPKWAGEMLKRSKMAPLTIKADAPYTTPKTIDALLAGFSQLPRAKHVSVSLQGSALEKLFSSLKEEAPMLEVLKIRDPQHTPIWERDYVLPEDFLAGGAPNLRHLTLIKCSIPWTSPILHGLTHLRIQDSSVPFSTKDVISALRQIPNIQVLQLDHCLSNMHGSIEDDEDDHVELPALTNLHLSGSTLECHGFLQHITFPNQAIVKIVAAGDSATRYDFSPIFVTLASRYEATQTTERPLTAEFDCRPMSANTEYGVHIRLWNTKRPSGVELRAASPAIELSLAWAHYCHSSWENVIRSFTYSMPLNKLKALHVVKCNMSSQGWLESFGKLPFIKSISINEHYLDRFIGAFRQCMFPSATKVRSSRERMSIGALPFPKLRSVTFNACQLVGPRNGEDAPCSEEVLLEALQMRHALGAKTEILRLSNCAGFSSDYIERLRKFVSTVEWDESLGSGGIFGVPDGEDTDSDGEEPDGLLFGESWASTGRSQESYYGF